MKQTPEVRKCSRRCGLASVLAGCLAFFVSASLAGFLLAPSRASATEQLEGPSAPQGIEVVQRDEDRGLRVTLSWSHRPECDSYKVYRSSSIDGPYQWVGAVSGGTMAVFPFFLDDGATGGNTYFYKVSALDDHLREGPRSTPVCTTPREYRRATGIQKSIIVSLSDQHAYFFENGICVNVMRCSTGTYGTPVGNYRIYSHRGTVSGCVYWMDWKPNYGMHGWPGYIRGYEENLGRYPCSHGCIRLHPLEAYWPYYWSPNGTPLTTTYESLRSALPLKGTSCVQGTPFPSNTWYFADGLCGNGFTEHLLLYNPGVEAVTAVANYYPDGHAPVTDCYLMMPKSRVTINVNEVAGVPHGFGHSIEIGCHGPIVAHRSQYFDYCGRRGGHATVGASSPSTEWYLPRCFTNDNHDTFLSVFNPGEETAGVTLTYTAPARVPCDQFLQVQPKSRGYLSVDSVPGFNEQMVSVIAKSDQPVVAERATYFSLSPDEHWVNGGDASLGSPYSSTVWFLAEGNTGTYYDQHLLVLNPGYETANVNVEYCTSRGAVLCGYSVGPLSCINIPVDSIGGLHDSDTPMVVTADRNVVVERSMYCYRDSRRGGNASTAYGGASTQWYFAEGSTRDSFNEQVRIFNPNLERAVVTVHFQLDDGTSVYGAYAISPKTRITVTANEKEGLWMRYNAVEVHGDRPVVAELVHDFCIPR